MAKELLVYSDDATGALDVAGSFYSRGYNPVVEIVETNENFNTDCLILNLNSRYDTYTASFVKIATAKKGDKNNSVFFKVDSTLRGNIIRDSHAIASEYAKPVLIAPAFPFYGRTCINGKYFVSGIPIEETEFAKDPAFHHNYSFLNDNNPNILHVNSDSLKMGKNSLIRYVKDSSYRIFSFDTQTNADLEKIAQLGRNLDAILMGSSGLARSFDRKNAQTERFSIDKSLPSLFIIGSTTEIARQQLIALSRKSVAGIHLDHHDIGNDKNIELINQTLLEHLALNGFAYLATPEQHIPDKNFMKAVEESVAKISNINKIKHNLVIAGGETANAVFHGRRIKTLFVKSEFSAGIPISTQKDMTEAIVTKAGAFGNSNTLVDIYNFLK